MEVDFCNSAVVRIFSELGYTSTKFREKTTRNPEKKVWFYREITVIQKKLQYVVCRVREDGKMDEGMETWSHGNIETWQNGDMEKWRHGNMETWKHGDMET